MVIIKKSDVASSVQWLITTTLYSAFVINGSSAHANPTSNDPPNSIEHIYNEAVAVAYFDPIVVTATRSEKNLSDAPIAIQVLDHKKLQDNHAHTLKEALQLLPNVNLVPLHGKTGYEVRMQGFSGDQVLILIDGLPISASTGSTVNLNQYLNTNVEQIEVIQGAASAQYGSSAMGGVINVISKPITTSNASITAELGSNGSENPSAKSLDNNRSYVEADMEGAISADGRIKARLAGAYLEDKGLSVDTDAWPLLKDPSKQKQLNAKVTYTPNIDEVNQSNPSSQYWLEASVYQEEDISRFTYFVPPRTLKQQRDEDIGRQRVSLSAKTQFSPQSNAATPTPSTAAYKLSGSLLYENYDSQSNTMSGSLLTSTRDANMQTNLAQVQLDLPLIYSGDTQAHAVQLGTKWQLDSLIQIKNNVPELRGGDVDRDVIEAYIQDDWMMGDSLEMVLGARYQDDSDFGDHFAPKLAVKKDYKDDSDRLHVFRASVGTGYRVPNLKERYYLFDHSNYGYKVIGNPNLEPETSTSYQLGYQTNIRDNIAFNVNGFYNEVKDLIQTDSSRLVYQGNIAIYSYDNVDAAETYGADAIVDWLINDKTSLSLAYAYLSTKNNTTGSELTYSPKNRITANFEYQITPKLQLIQQVRYESRELVSTSTQNYSPSWWGLDSRANYDATSQLNLYLAIDNLLDEQRDVDDAYDRRPVDNRLWIVGAAYHW